MMEQTKILAALRGVRGRRPVDLPALEQLLVRFSWLVIEQPWIREVDINPLLASPDGLLALDARVIAQSPDVREAEFPRPAIRPYPAQYVASWTSPDGTPLVIRPIRPEDEPMIVAIHGTLSAQSVALRYFHAIKPSRRVDHERLVRICFIDCDREMALVVAHDDPSAGAREMIGVGRLSKVHGTNEAEFALFVADHWQNRGLGGELLRRLIQVGRDERLTRIVGEILHENGAMQHLCRKLGFRLSQPPDEPLVRATIDL